jgi:hypothetical protein
MTIWPTTTIVLTVFPSLNGDGRKAYSTRGQLFDGAVDGKCIVKRTVMPLLDAARALLAQGIKPDTVLIMRHEGSTCDALRSTVGAAAKLTVRGKPVFEKWRPSPYDRQETSAVPPPVSETEAAAAQQVPDVPELGPEPIA